MAVNETLTLLEVFNDYVTKRKAYEQAKLDAATGEVISTPKPIPSINSSEFSEFISQVHNEVDERLQLALGLTGTAQKFAELKAVLHQAETIYRSVRAESLRTSNFSRRTLMAIGRRKAHVTDGGLIDKVIVDPIEKSVLSAKVT